MPRDFSIPIWRMLSSPSPQSGDFGPDEVQKGYYHFIQHDINVTPPHLFIELEQPSL